MVQRLLLGAFVSCLVLGTAAAAQEADLIMDPTISAYGGIPMRGGKIVRRDTMPPDWKPGPTHVANLMEGVEKSDWPGGAVIKGKLPGGSRRWAVAVTTSAEEFREALPEYRRLIAAGKWREANETLHVSTYFNISTRVEEYLGNEKIRDLPEKVNTFRFMLSTIEFKKYGGYLTFLTFTKDPEYPMVGVGPDIGETVHGEILVTAVPGDHGYKYGFAMEVIRAKFTKPSEE